MKKLLLFFILNLITFSQLYAEEKKIGLLIFSDTSQKIAEKLKSEILDEFDKYGYVSSKSASKQLVIYVNRDFNDDINPNGISLSIAHIDAYHVPIILKVLENKEIKDKKSAELLVTLIKEHGFLKHLSSIHLSKGNDNQVSIASKSVVKTFISKNFK
jgi:hypothetical protein